jgi:hypothetical protein
LRINGDRRSLGSQFTHIFFSPYPFFNFLLKLNFLNYPSTFHHYFIFFFSSKSSYLSHFSSIPFSNSPALNTSWHQKRNNCKKIINDIQSNITSYDCRSPISFISSCHVIFIISLFKLWIKKRRLYRHHNWIEKGNIHIHVWETLSRWSIVHIQLDRSTGWKLSGSTLPLHSPLYIMFVIPILYFGEYFIIILAVPYGFHMNRST